MSNGIIGVFVGDNEVKYCTDVNGEISVLMPYNVFKQLSDNSSYKISNNSEIFDKQIDKMKIEHERRMKEIDDEHNLRIGKHLQRKDESIKKLDSLDTNKSNLNKRFDDLDKNVKT